MKTHKDWDNWDDNQRQKYVDGLKRAYPQEHPYSSYQNKTQNASPSVSSGNGSKKLLSALSEKPVRPFHVASVSLATNEKPEGMTSRDWKVSQHVFNGTPLEPMTKEEVVEFFKKDQDCHAFEVSNTGVRLKKRFIRYDEPQTPDDTLAMVDMAYDEGIKELEIGIGGFADVFSPQETQQFEEVCKRHNTSLNTNRKDKKMILEHWFLANTSLGSNLLLRGWRVDGVGCDDIRNPMGGYFKITKK